MAPPLGATWRTMQPQPSTKILLWGDHHHEPDDACQGHARSRKRVHNCGTVLDDCPPSHNRSDPECDCRYYSKFLAYRFSYHGYLPRPKYRSHYSDRQNSPTAEPDSKRLPVYSRGAASRMLRSYPCFLKQEGPRIDGKRQKVHVIPDTRIETEDPCDYGREEKDE